MRSIACTVAALCALALAARAQEPTPAPKPEPAVAPPASTAPPLVPGELPAEASPDSRALWAALGAASRESEVGEDPATHAPVTRPKSVAKPNGFDLTFAGTVHPEERQSNDMPTTRYRFDARGYVRMTVVKSGRERLLGPKGPFLVEETGQVTSLEGREHEEDRRQIRDELSIAKNFLALADPRSLRVAKLVKLAAPPREVPDKPSELAAAAKALEWLEIESPDFHLFQSNAPAADASYRVQIGLDPKTHLPRLATVVELHAGKPALDAGALMVDLQNYAPLDGLMVPKSIVTYGVDKTRMPWGYSRWSTMELSVLPGGKLHTQFTDAEFLPTPKK